MSRGWWCSLKPNYKPFQIEHTLVAGPDSRSLQGSLKALSWYMHVRALNISISQESNQLFSQQIVDVKINSSLHKSSKRLWLWPSINHFHNSLQINPRWPHLQPFWSLWYIRSPRIWQQRTIIWSLLPGGERTSLLWISLIPLSSLVPSIIWEHKEEFVTQKTALP